MNSFDILPKNGTKSNISLCQFAHGYVFESIFECILKVKIFKIQSPFLFILIYNI